MREKKYKDREWLKENYIKKRLPLESIAWECNCSRMTISRWLRKHGLEARDRVQAVKERFK